MSAPSPTPRILVFGSTEGDSSPLLHRLKSDHDFVVPHSIKEGLENLHDDNFAGVLFLGKEFPAAGGLLETGGVLEQIPDAVVLVDINLTILVVEPSTARNYQQPKRVWSGLGIL